MRTLLLALVATAAFAAPLTAPIPCTKNELFEITDTATSIGCTSYVNNMNVTWILKGNVGRVLDFSLLNTETNYDYIEVFYEQKSQGKFSGKGLPDTQLSLGPGDIRVTFVTDGSNIWEGFTLSVFPRPTLNDLVSSQPRTLNTRQEGGFVYFGLPPSEHGRLFHMNVAIFSYEGMKPPGCFVFVNGFPTLEHFHYTNTTEEQPGKVYTCTLSVATPKAGAWNIGMFLYGAAAKMTVTATWTFELPQMQPSQLYNGTVQGMYQIFVPIGVPALKFQLSREAPGGYPVAYISQGSLPSPTRYRYSMDTRQSSYITLPILNPNPHGSESPNPGTYVILIKPAEGNTAGYLFRADW